jgi:hypothetical protein
MSENHDDIDPFISALRNDLPDSIDQERVQRQLVALGVFAGSAGLSIGAKAASVGAKAASLSSQQSAWLSAAPQLGVLGKIATLGLSTKVGLSVLAMGGLAGLVTLPMVEQAWNTPAPGQKNTAAEFSEDTNTTAPQHQAISLAKSRDHTPSRASRDLRNSIQKTAKLTNKSRTHAGQEKLSTEPTHASSELKHETRLMEQAIAASQRGELAEARRYLELHARIFPQGLLATERQRLSEKLNKN